MSKRLNDEKSAEKDGPSLLSQGPYRYYQPIGTYCKHRIGRLNLLDGVLSIALAAGFALFMIKVHPADFLVSLNEREQEVYEGIEYYKSGKFRLNPIPPFGFQLYSLVPLKKEVLRNVSLTFASLTLSVLYLILRRVSVLYPFAIGSTVALASLPLYQLESTSVSVETLQWLLLSLVFYFWRSHKCYEHFQKKWFINLAFLSVTLGLGASTKFIGCFTWLWICVLSCYEFWNVIADAKLSTCHLIKFTIFKSFFIGIIPLTLFASSLILQITNWTEDAPEYSQFMSPNFKTFLRGPVVHPKYLYYDSIITIRHLDSMGGYLHSHNYTYPTGSREQQVTLSQIEDDFNNQWKVENPKANSATDSQPKKVNDFGKIRLRHCATGRLLRASSAKPPVSEQDYDSEVSCTGDADYLGDSDELWTIISIDDPLHSPLKPLKSVVKFLNEGQRCTMLAHDIKLPSWGFNQQEVLCLQSPTEFRALFEIETTQYNSYQNIEYDTFSGDTRKISGLCKLLVELVQKQYKYNYYERNYKVQSKPSPDKWPFQLFNERHVNHLWLSTLFFVLLYVLYQTKQLLTWNPWNDEKLEKALSTIIYEDFGLECSLGWLFHYYPFTKSPHEDQKLVLYLSSLIIGQLLVWNTLSTWYKWRPLSGILLCIYVAYLLPL